MAGKESAGPEPFSITNYLLGNLIYYSSWPIIEIMMHRDAIL